MLSRPYEPTFNIPGETWLSILRTPAPYELEFFSKVMLNLIRNPNITSSYLFRAEIYYDSDNDASLPSADGTEADSFTRHMKPELRPLPASVPGYERTRTFVRRLVPRNPALDASLVQTCHLFSRTTAGGEEESVVLYIPHVTSPDDMPYYHPTVRALAFQHISPASGPPSNSSNPNAGSLSIHYALFPTTPLTPRLTRTALALAQIITKHSLGQKAGYTKRVHHDLLVPQKAVQDTYTRLKGTYARRLIEGWVETTDPSKHVFEDLGIAAFLVEVWGGVYAAPRRPGGEGDEGRGKEGGGEERPPFPGFVDIGCGNGLLVHILRSEGWEGWGFDARARKTWSALPPSTSAHLKELLLVPRGGTPWHNGLFPPHTFLIANHADELTPWTPLLASLSASAFVAIPCCSHDLAGARTRFSTTSPTASTPSPSIADPLHSATSPSADGPGPKAGSLARKSKPPSAYAALTAYVASLSAELGFRVEKEMLRIPSTRNACVVGRPSSEMMEIGAEERGRVVEKIKDAHASPASNPLC
ncbi:DUF1613-domain-containing protein [Trichodelitschia bisporula]|uniref:tRNA (uracil-O(2)-)-methyltransferase n=1 Tax=Trichodelitschia bisporula TaxID=703511 RepID=A0A6G1I7A9_9PEZI|nr:DUF1613-domain-containing protein [Trichodelitschia bisporula]